MSTRCQIVINEECSIKNPIAIIYKHHDGYPESEHGIIHNILPFLQNFKRERGNGLEHLAARLLQHIVNKYNAQYTGIGLCRELHGDIEYLYIITDKYLYVYKMSYTDNVDSGKKKIKAQSTLLEKIEI